jgi:hypothetical protein
MRGLIFAGLSHQAYNPGVMKMPVSRRSFLKLGAVAGVAAFTPNLNVHPRIGAAWPIPQPHVYFPNPDVLLEQSLAGFDAVLVPAYVAAELIRRGAVQTLNGPRGRAHDPEGAFTMPYVYAHNAIVHRGEPPRSWDELWSPDTVWWPMPRLVLGLALQRRGYSVNDWHPGHLAQCGRDLALAQIRQSVTPIERVRSGAARFGITLISESTPIEGLRVTPLSLLVEYDWVIPKNAARPFIPNLQSPISNSQTSASPLIPWPTAARAQAAALWAALL